MRERVTCNEGERLSKRARVRDFEERKGGREKGRIRIREAESE